jgi:hypothetical protein
MRIDCRYAPVPLLMVFVAACSGSADSESASDPTTPGESTFALDSAEGVDANAQVDAEVDKGRGRARQSEARRHRGGPHHPHHGGGGTPTPPPPEPGQSCEAAGQTFPDGSGVPSGDSCNTCSCADGSVVCTLALCEPVFCALFVEESDGVCSRFPNDPCISQDPDCVDDGGSCEAAGQTFPNGSDVPSGDSCNSCGCNDGSVTCTLALCEPVVCALFVEQPDGVCSRFPLDPCISQDPDCIDDGGSCEAAGQTFPNGSAVPSGDDCNSCGCNDGSVICTLAACDPVFCALFVEESDGVCSRFPNDPCISQDPDCFDGGSCEAAGQSFPNGSAVPSGDDCNTCGCNDGSVLCTLALCEPVFCALFVEQSDGFCSRFPNDPCISQDPDCTSASEPTAP